MIRPIVSALLPFTTVAMLVLGCSGPADQGEDAAGEAATTDPLKAADQLLVGKKLRFNADLALAAGEKKSKTFNFYCYLAATAGDEDGLAVASGSEYTIAAVDRASKYSLLFHESTVSLLNKEGAARFQIKCDIQKAGWGNVVPTKDRLETHEELPDETEGSHQVLTLR